MSEKNELAHLNQPLAKILVDVFFEILAKEMDDNKDYHKGSLLNLTISSHINSLGNCLNIIANNETYTTKQVQKFMQKLIRCINDAVPKGT